MILTDGAWLPLADVLEQAGVKPDADDAAAVDRKRKAAAAYVERNRRDLRTVVDDVVTFTPTPEVVEGAIMLAARLHARKGSPTGVASYGEFGPAAIVRYDADIERLLGVGRSAKPVIG